MPPIVTRQRELSEDAGDKVLQAALEQYKNDAAVLELVDSIRRFSSQPLTTGNRVSVLIDGPQTYSALEAALRAARHDIHIETFIFGAGEVGQRFADLGAPDQAARICWRLTPMSRPGISTRHSAALIMASEIFGGTT